MPIITFKNVSFSYRKAKVLDRASFAVEKGEYVGIVGPNGGGKTTSLKLILGFLSPNEGTIEVLGKTSMQARTKIGYVPQLNTCDPAFPISALEVALTGSLKRLNWRGKYPSSEKERAQTLFADMGLQGLEKRRFGSLSGGQTQKVLIVRALMCDPEILLLDEPTANVDPESEEAIFTYLKTLQGKKTVLIVTHNFDATLKHVGRVLCFQHTVSSFLPQEVCKHFTMGMYHG